MRCGGLHTTQGFFEKRLASSQSESSHGARSRERAIHDVHRDENRKAAQKQLVLSCHMVFIAMALTFMGVPRACGFDGQIGHDHWHAGTVPLGTIHDRNIYLFFRFCVRARVHMRM